MAKYRYVYTDFWTDGKIIEEFTPEDKLFFLYLLTNEHTTQIGVYQITKKQMAFELGYSTEVVNTLMDRFISKHGLILYNDETRELAIKNWGRYNLTKAGKPILDCVRKELESVKDIELLTFVIDSVSNESINSLYINAINGRINYAEPSKQSKPKDSKTVTKREYIILRDMQRCFYTGIKLQLKDIELDHIKPVNSNGSGGPENLVVSYNKFNNFKAASEDLQDVITRWNDKYPEMPIDFEELQLKLLQLRTFEKERLETNITYAEAVENNLYDTWTLRNYLNTIRGQKEKEKENKKENEKEKQQESSASPSEVVDDLQTKVNPFLFYQENGFGLTMNSITQQKIMSWCDDLSDELVIHAMQKAIESNRISWSYAEGILKNWASKQVKSIQDVQAIEAQFAAQQQVKQQRPYGKQQKVEQVPEWYEQQKRERQGQQPSTQTPVVDFEAERRELLKKLGRTDV